jgi:hypothetical protein
MLMRLILGYRHDFRTVLDFVDTPFNVHDLDRNAGSGVAVVA